MKRLLIATFLLVVSVTIYAVTVKPTKKEACPKTQQTCCLKKTRPAQPAKSNNIFWEPVTRLIMIHK